MAKVGVSVSMEVEMASDLKAEAAQEGENFSSLVVGYIIAGRNLKRGLMDQTSVSEQAEIPESPILDVSDPKARVYSSLTSEPQPLAKIAEVCGLEEGNVGDILEDLAESGEPIILRPIASVWHAWEGEKS